MSVVVPPTSTTHSAPSWGSSLLLLRQVPGAHHAGRRPRQDRLDGPLHGPLGPHQRAIALDHHQRRGDPPLGQGVAQRVDQLAEQRHQPGVEGHGRRAPDRVEACRQLVAAGDRQPGHALDQRFGLFFVGRVAHTEIARHSKGFDAARRAGHRLAQGSHVERHRLVTANVVPTVDIDHVGGDQVAFKATLPDQLLVVADQDQAHRAALSLDDGVGRQRRRQGDQAHLGRGRRARLLKSGVDSRTDAERQVAPGRQRLGGA